jgi:hypothetical protein
VHGSPRIAAQGVFTVHGRQRGARRSEPPAHRYGPGLHDQIPADAIGDIRRQLAIAGVTETSVFHELDGLCREIKAEFFGE